MWGFMKKETERSVLKATIEVVANKGFDCSLREISNASDVSYGHIHRTWETKEILMREAEKLLHEEIRSALGETSALETVQILLVKTWFSLQSVTHSRRFLVQTTNPSYPKYEIENPLKDRLLAACLRHSKENPGGTDPRVMAASLYLIAINVEPATLKRVCEDFEVPHLPEELSILYLNHLNTLFTKK